MRGRPRWEACRKAKSSTSPECSPRSTPASTPRRTRARWWRGTTTTGHAVRAATAASTPQPLTTAARPPGWAPMTSRLDLRLSSRSAGTDSAVVTRVCTSRSGMGAAYDVRSRRQERLGELTLAVQGDGGARGGGRHRDQDERATLERPPARRPRRARPRGTRTRRRAGRPRGREARGRRDPGVRSCLDPAPRRRGGPWSEALTRRDVGLPGACGPKPFSVWHRSYIVAQSRGPSH